MEELEIDQKAMDQLTKDVSEKVGAELSEKLATLVKESVAETTNSLVEQSEAIVDKKINAIPYLKRTGDVSKEGKEMRLYKAVRALARKDYGQLDEYNAFNKELIAKAGYQSTGTDADGGYVVVDPEFEAQVDKIIEQYGVAVNEVTVVPVTSNSIKTNKRGSNVTMYEVSEGASITASKMTIDQDAVNLRKFAGIAVNTNELTEDQAIDWYNELVQGFGEEAARLQDVQVFTDTNATYPGILKLGSGTGVYTETVGSALTDMTWDDLLNAQYKVPTVVGQAGKFYMNRTIWNLLMQVKDDNSRYQFDPKSGLLTPWGTPVVLVDVMPSVTYAPDSNEPYIIFGDLRRSKMYTKRGLTIATSTDATITDQASASQALFQNDMNALRVTKREVVLHKFPEANCLIGIGTVS